MVDINFDYKTNFPMGTVISAIQRKAELEQQMKDKNREVLLQGLKDIGQVGASLSARRQQMAQALALSQNPEVQGLLTGGNRPVTEGVNLNQTADGSSGVPVQNAPNLAPQQIASLLGNSQPLDVLKAAFERTKALTPQMAQETVYQKDAAGNIIGTTTRSVPKGSKSTVVGPQPTGAGSRSGMADARQRQLAAARVKEKVINEISEIQGGTKQINDLYDKYIAMEKVGKAGSPAKGATSLATAFVTGGKGGSADAKAYRDLRSGLVAKLKKITGDTGVLTEQDAARIIGLLPSLLEDKEAAKIKIDQINDILQAAKQRSGAKGRQLISDIQSGNTVGFEGINDGAANPDPLGIL